MFLAFWRAVSLLIVTNYDYIIKAISISTRSGHQLYQGTVLQCYLLTRGTAPVPLDDACQELVG